METIIRDEPRVYTYDINELASLADARKVVSETSWLWQDYLPRGHVSILAGSGGIGKTLVMLDLVKRILGGTTWPDGTPCEKVPFIMWADTEGTQALLCHRTEKLGIPDESIRFAFPKHDPLGDLRLDDSAVWKMFESAVKRHRPPAVIVDSLCGSHGGDEDSAKIMTKVLGKLQRLARDVNCLMLVCHHIRKKGEEYATDIRLDDLRGSSAIAANARTVYAIEPCNIDEPDGTRRLKCLKSNLSIFGDTLAFEVDEEEILWVDTPEAEQQKSEQAKARDFLRAFLRGGPQLAKDVETVAKKSGLAFRTVRRAKKDLPITHKKQKDGCSLWVLGT